MQIGDIVIKDLLYPVKVSIKSSAVIIRNSVGEIKNYPAGFEETIIEIDLKIMDQNTLQSLVNFIIEIAGFKKNTFVIIPDSKIDFGNGLGQPVTVRYWSDEIKTSLESPGIYAVSLKLRRET